MATNPFNIPPAKPSVAGILDRALTGGAIGKTIKAAQQFASLTPEKRQLVIDVGTGKIKSSQPTYKNTSLSQDDGSNISLPEAVTRGVISSKQRIDIENGSEAGLPGATIPNRLIRPDEYLLGYLSDLENKLGRTATSTVTGAREALNIPVQITDKDYITAANKKIKPISSPTSLSMPDKGPGIIDRFKIGFEQGWQGNRVPSASSTVNEVIEQAPGAIVEQVALEMLTKAPTIARYLNRAITTKTIEIPIEELKAVYGTGGSKRAVDFLSKLPEGEAIKYIRGAVSAKINVPRQIFEDIKSALRPSTYTGVMTPAPAGIPSVEGATMRGRVTNALNKVLPPERAVQITAENAPGFIDLGSQAERGIMTSQKDLRTKLPRAGIEKPAPLPDYTTRVLDMLGDRKTVSRQFINDLTNRPELRQAERDLIRSKLAEFDNNADPLVNEAKKYKSAEEFVKAQGETVYRGGVYNSSAITDRGVSFSYDQLQADKFRSNESRPSETLVIDKKANILQWADLPDGIKNSGFTNNELEMAAIKYAKGKGYDGVKLDGIFSGKEKEIRIFNPDVIKTKSQLTDIWNKAQKGDTIDVPEFVASVRGDLLPLERKNTSIDYPDRMGNPGKITNYENITLPAELRGKVSNYYENIYQSPVKTNAGQVHYNLGDNSNYFAHTRIEDLPDNTRRVIEVQSDLFQKGRLEKEGRDVEDARYFVERGKRGEYGGEPESVLTEAIKRQKELTRLEPYRNSWYERVIREEVKQASKDGKTKVQFPTGETAMKIEGLAGRGNNDFLHYEDSRGLVPSDIVVGQKFNDQRYRGRGTANRIIIEKISNEEFKAIPLNNDAPEILHEAMYEVGDTKEYKQALAEYAKKNKNLAELFSIKEDVDANNPIYKYYEKDVQKFLKREYPDMKRVKDSQGVEWFEVDTTPKPGQLSYGEKPVFAFKEKPREGGISEEARARADLQRAGELRGNSPYSSIPQGRENIGGIEKKSFQPQEIGQVGVEPVQLQRDPKVLNTPQSQDVLPVQSQLGNVSDGALGTTIPTKQTLVNKVAELDAVKNEFDNLTEEIRAPIEAEIYNELAHSKAGERYQLPDGTFTGMASTFPKWIPYGDLRTSDLVQKVMKSMFSGKELKGKAGQLQEIVLAEIEKRMKPHELYSYYSEMRDYVKKLQTETAQEFRAGVGDIGNAEQLPFGVEGLEGAPPSAPTPGMLNLAKDVLKYKDISGFYGQMRDVYRNFKKVFGDRFAAVKREILDPFDSAKGMFIDDQKRLLEDLDRVIVKELGIRKGSKESAAVMDYGEKLISFTDLEKYFGTAKAEKIVAADRWFRNKYNELIDEVNNVRTRIYPGNPDKLVPKRQDYYRHFQELPQTLLGIRSIFEDPVAISPSLSGISEFTQPKTKWAGFMQKRKGNASVRDAVGGFLDYVPTATYAKWIDPQIAKFRGLAKTLAAATEDTKNLNNFIEFLQDFSNDLAGKTNAADRYIQKSIPGGRTTFRFIDFLNKKIKANAVLGNASSAIAQLFNIPQGIATAKQHSLKGMARTLGQIFHENKPMMESSFLKERYARSLFDKFETRYLAKAKNFAAWFTGVGDEIGTKFIWNSQYEKALAEGIANPVKYADDITRELVAGRGVGEVPLAQKSKLFQLVAPFQLEVTNLWYVMGDMVSKKDFAALATLFAANFLMNRAAEQIRGNPVVFDPIEATIEGVQRLKGERDWKVGTGKLVGRLAGEVLSNIPFGSDFSKYIIPENSRADFFGEADPTRFGQGLIPKVIQGGRSEIPMLLLPFGGAQLKKTYGTVKALMNNGQVKSSSGKTTNFSIRNKSIPNITKGLLFGQYATEEGQKYLNRNKRTKSLFNIPSASGNNPFKLQSGNTSGNPFVLPKAR